MKKKLTIQSIKKLRPHSKAYEVRDTDIKGFLLRVQPTGAMTYYLVYTTPEKGKNRYRIGRHGNITPAQARDVAEKLSGKVAHGNDLQVEKKAKKAKAERDSLNSLEAFLERSYEPWVEVHRKTGKQTVRRVKLHFSDLLNKPMYDINTWVIEKWRTARLKADISPATINRDLTALKAVLSKALEWDVIDTHPLVTLKPIKVDHNPKIRYLTNSEEERLHKALKNRDTRIRTKRISANEWRKERGYAVLPSLENVTYVDYLQPMVVLAMNTGMRRGEIFDLTWNDINLRSAIATIYGPKAKSGSTRHIPLNQDAIDALMAWKKQSRGDDYVFPNKEGKRLDNIRRSWAGLLVAAKIKDFRFHDLRHHFASKLVMAGVDLNTVRELLGHSDIKMTLRYAHLAPEHKAEAVARLLGEKKI